MTTTQTIASHEFTLTKGHRYLASRPMAGRGMTHFDVKITDITDGYTIDARPVAVMSGLGYEAANEVLRRFNNGKSSFAGRVW